MLQSVTTIQGERVLLRPPHDGDAEEAARVWTPELRHMYGGSRLAPRRPAALAAPPKTDDNEHRFHIEADGRYIGHVGLRPNDEEQSGGYRIGIVNPDYWGKGYGTEVTRLILRYAFETLGLHRVRLRVTAYNHRARRCYERCGFRVEGIERESFLVDGEWQDDVLMAILREEWEAYVVPSTARDHGDGGGESHARERSVAAVRIRSYRAEDHPAVLALWEAAGLHRGASDEAEVVARKLRLERGPFLVAEAEGQIVGTVMGHVDRCWGWVNRLAVHPEWRRRGLARRLVAEAERSLQQLGATTIHLLTHEGNAVALGLYESLGYTRYRQIVYMNKELPCLRQDNSEESKSRSCSARTARATQDPSGVEEPERDDLGRRAVARACGPGADREEADMAATSAGNLWAVTGGILSRMVHVRRLLSQGEAPARPLVEAAALARLLERVVPAEEVDAAAAAMSNLQREHSEEVGVGPGYALWSATYDTEPNPLILVEEPATLALLGDVSGKDVLDAACGTGRYAVQLAQAGARVCGLDPSAEMLARARDNCDAAGTAVAWREGELCALPYADASFDAAVCALALCHVPDLRTAIAELARVLRPGGSLVLSDFHPYCLMLGWRTCFVHGGCWYLIRNELHQISDTVSALRASGMVLTDLREELVDDRLAPMLGEEVELFRDQPIALIVGARKGTEEATSRGVEESERLNSIDHR